MKAFLRQTAVIVLRLLAKLVLRRYRPNIVAVTGSVGKTTTKDLTAAMLGGSYRLRKSPGSYNSEFGVPLTILGQRMPTGFGAGLRLAKDALGLLLGKHDYPEVLVLEMAADRPGDLGYLTRLAPPDIGVVTNVRNVHLERYESVEAIAEEKSAIIRNLKPGGVGVLNFDDTRTRMMRALAPAGVVFYGMSDEANVWMTDVTVGPDGTSGTILVREHQDSQPQRFPVETRLLGVHQLYAVLAAFSVAYSVGVNPADALAAAKKFEVAAGRGRLFSGAGKSTVIDDTYNASPQAVMASLDVLEHFPKPRVAVLGDMRELGQAREAGHAAVGEYAAHRVEHLITLGEDARLIAQAAEEAGMSPGRIHQSESAEDAAAAAGRAAANGTVLVKGSQGVYLERVVKELLADPRDESRLVQRPIPEDAP